tara:strand:- start:623 stop:1234 length:612 start_codon:yes stop_codon:yes gene_type:complete
MPYEFIYDIPDGGKFRGPLEQFQCAHTNPISNIRCKRKGYLGYDRCWQHMRSDFHVRIKKSTIPGAGKGLFADCPDAEGGVCFPAGKGNNNVGQRIVYYDGERIDKKTLEDRYGEGTAPYAIQVNKDLFEDAALRRTVGSFANAPLKGVKPNAKLYSYNSKAALGSIRKIKDGEEIFADYGREYLFDSSYTANKYSPPKNLNK